MSETKEDTNELQQIIAELTLMNNHFMNKVFSGANAATQLLLRIILKNDTIKVKQVRTQNFIENLYGHSAQLDILAEDESGRQFNVEVQRSDEGAAKKRARFYSSALDMLYLDKGKSYEKLKDSYVIFITENDVLEKGLPVYNIRRFVEEDGALFGDGSYIVYVNGSCRDDSAIGKLMRDFNCTDPDKMNYKELADRVGYLKKSKEGEVDMTDIIEVYAKKKAKEAAEKAAKEAAEKAEKAIKKVERRAEKKERQTIKTIAQRMLANGMSVELTAQSTELTEKEVRALAAKLSA